MQVTSSRPASLARGAAVVTLATALSRVTGFLRVVVVAAAMGTTFLANTYQTANTAPNVLFELVAAGILTSIFVPTFVEYLVREEREQGWHAANVLTSFAVVALVGLALVLALAAPLVMRLLTLGVEDDSLRAGEVRLGTTFLRLFAPQVVFYGVGMIMTSALHAHRRFGLAAVAPILNNVVVIAAYLTYAFMRGDRPPTVGDITTGETLVLGLGTTLGVVAMTLVLWPQLSRLGWRFRFRWDRRHPALRKAARVGAWALGYAGGYQAGLIVVLLLANRVEGGVAAYQWAFTFFFVPHALFAAPIFHVLFPAMSEHAAKGEDAAVAARLRDGLAMLGFILIPVALAMLVVAGPLARLTLEYGVMTETGASLVGRVIGAFAIGLPTYSAFLVFTRAYYAIGDTKTPTLVNGIAVAIATVTGVGLFVVLAEEWSVAGLALGHSLAFAVGTYVLARRLSRVVGHLGATALAGAVVRALLAGGAGFAAMALVRLAVPLTSTVGELVELIVTLGIGGGVYLGVTAWLRSPELARALKVVRGARA